MAAQEKPFDPTRLISNLSPKVDGSGFNFNKEPSTDGNSEEKNQKCQHCDETFKYKIGLIEHMKKRTPDQLFKCEAEGCQMAFCTNSGYYAHFREKHESAYPCNVCDHSFAQKKVLETHIQNRKPGEITTCKLCNFKSCTISGHLMHVQRAHKNEPTKGLKIPIKKEKKNFQCDSCEMKFPDEPGYNQHMANQMNGDFVLCNHCPFSSCSEKGLAKHVQKNMQTFKLLLQLIANFVT